MEQLIEEIYDKGKMIKEIPFCNIRSKRIPKFGALTAWIKWKNFASEEKKDGAKEEKREEEQKEVPEKVLEETQKEEREPAAEETRKKEERTLGAVVMSWEELKFRPIAS